MANKPGITSVHGKVRDITIGGIKVKPIPLFHPAAIIYNQVVKGELAQKSLF